VCNNIDKYSCLQCYINGDYDTGNCATSCIGKFGKSFCFDLNSVIRIIVIVEEHGGKVIIVMFFPVTRKKILKGNVVIDFFIYDFFFFIQFLSILC
jgi:hypothetical protein